MNSWSGGRRSCSPHALLLLACLLATPLGAQVALETEPVEPQRGTLFSLRATPLLNDLVSGIEGEIAGEPLHFARGDGIAWESLAGTSVEGGDSVAVTIILLHGDLRDTIVTSIAVARAEYALEQLEVAPRMARPDSAGRRRIARDNARARRISRAAHDTPRLWTKGFILPRGSRITSPFGTGREYNGTVVSRHMGIDFSGAVGDPVRATNSGRVALIDDFYLAGKVIYLDHGAGLVSAYFHLSRALVRPGQRVMRGQIIGRVGRSGRVTGPHLHWAMRYGETTIDPMSVMRLLGDGE